MLALYKKIDAHRLVLQILVAVVGLYGIILILSTLNDSLLQKFGIHTLHMRGFVFGLPILFGLTLLYLSILLRRRKHNAWVATLVVYGLVWAFGMVQLLFLREGRPLELATILRNVILPLAIVICLVIFRREFIVKSDTQGFKSALRFSILVMAVAFVYGVSGFLLIDKHDFRQEITLGEAVHRTVDQFDLTTSGSLTPHTRRAKVFLDSLSVVSTGAVIYVLISLFQPLRSRFADQTPQRELAKRLLKNYGGNSEDFFKLWPHDKTYYFNGARTAGVAYGVTKGVALVVGDPFGDAKAFPALIKDFEEFCRTNDWLVAFIHTEPQYSDLYKNLGFRLQKIGGKANQ